MKKKSLHFRDMINHHPATKRTGTDSVPYIYSPFFNMGEQTKFKMFGISDFQITKFPK
jgi:hypothetical protein